MTGATPAFDLQPASSPAAMGDRRRNIALPSIRLTDADRAEYASIVDESVRETLALYEDFAFRRNGHMDRGRWKLMRSKENARVYRERSDSDRDLNGVNGLGNSSSQSVSVSASSGNASRSAGEASSVSGSTGSAVDDDDDLRIGESMLSIGGALASVEIGPASALSANTKVPALVTTGRVSGEVDDILYGLIASDVPSILRRSLFEKDGTTDAVILGSMEKPSENHPFNSFIVAWLLNASSAPLMRDRDLLVLMKSGTTVTRTTGERVGYGVAQSVVHPDMPELRDQQIVRGLLSYCIIFRQLANQQQVETFIQIVLDPRGAVMTYFVLQDIAKRLLGLSSPVENAIRKKLSWFVRQARERRRQQRRDHFKRSSSNSTGSATSADILDDISALRPSSSAPSACIHCTKQLGSLFGAQGTRCSLCHNVSRLTLLHCEALA